MKRILVLSDSHGCTSKVEHIIKTAGVVDAVIFAGDGLKDFAFVRFSGTPLKVFVPGNCDGSHPVYDRDLVCEELYGKRVLVFHGHRHRVKESEEYAEALCRQMEADVCVFGHTHDPYVREDGGRLVLNPGSAAQGEYAVIAVNESRWTVSFHKV